MKEPVVAKTHRGLEYEFENPSGSTLNWIEQNSKNIPNAITIAKNSKNPGTAIEGKVGEFVNSKTEVTHFGVKVENITTGNRAGDIDIATPNQFIEVKKSTSVLKKDQIIKYTDSNDPNYFNYQNKEVIIYIDEPINMSNPRVVELIKSIEEIPGVKIVNSLDELGKVLK
ncbi:hypothetical protein [Paenibacillus xylaniclasticus]|uniref:hypothetical protein n=1 Tax=Paenibacillus xylaniclasticus TaxID=588083 RepID=UPI000FD9F5B8|nr:MULTISPECIES: hypothetical protein [Paenibacillus]GFN31044.1 hypothetical protein PCURB6_13040 [Paenibacillus curdlanolyticus]